MLSQERRRTQSLQSSLLLPYLQGLSNTLGLAVKSVTMPVLQTMEITTCLPLIGCCLSCRRWKLQPLSALNQRPMFQESKFCTVSALLPFVISASSNISPRIISLCLIPHAGRIGSEQYVARAWGLEYRDPTTNSTNTQLG